MSHELRTPMNAILGFAQLLGLDTQQQLTPTQKTSVDQILSGGKYLLQLIDRVLDLAKIESGMIDLSIKNIRLDNLCQQCLSMVSRQAEKNNLRVVVNLYGSPCVRADYVRLKQVLLNLLSNAIKYNRVGGTITFATQDVQDNWTRVSITDTGKGISEDLQPGLFEPFNRLGYEKGGIEGTGVGLAIAKQLVEAMGGHLGFESEVGKGSTFWVEMPSLETIASEKRNLPKTSKEIVSDADEQRALDGTVLYIEDNPANLNLMEAIINIIGGLNLISAHNAAEGISMAEEEAPNLILMDINLPGMDGLAAKRALDTIDIIKDIPVIAVSACVMKSDIEKGVDAEFKGYLTKPLNVRDVIAAIKKELS